MKWGDSKTIKFIRLYQMHPCLWDTSSRDYNVRNKRDEALNAILAKMNIPNFSHAACKTKIKNIRSQYCHELKRIRLSIKNGGRVHKPTLTWFDTVDRFLRPIVVHRTQNAINEKQPCCGHGVLAEQSSSDMADMEFMDYSRKITDDKSEEATTLKTEEVDVSDMESENLYEENTEACATSRNNLVVSPSISFSTKYALDAEDRNESECLKRLTTTIQKLESMVVKNAATHSTVNEFEVFGQSVAAQLTNMPIEDALLLQVEIQQLITSKRIGKLSSTQDNRRSNI